MLAGGDCFFAAAMRDVRDAERTACPFAVTARLADYPIMRTRESTCTSNTRAACSLRTYAMHMHTPRATPTSPHCRRAARHWRITARAALSSACLHIIHTRRVDIVHLGVPARVPLLPRWPPLLCALGPRCCRVARLSRDAYLLLQPLRLAHPCFEALWHCRLGNAATEF